MDVAIGVWIGGSEVLVERGDGCLSACDAHAWAKPREIVPATRVTLGCGKRLSAHFVAHRERRPEVVDGGSHCPAERLGYHADDRKTLAVQIDGSADNVRFGIELSAPETLADDEHGIAARFLIFVGQKRAAEDRTYSE
jgi:hypothetical protein